MEASDFSEKLPSLKNFKAFSIRFWLLPGCREKETVEVTTDSIKTNNVTKNTPEYIEEDNGELTENITQDKPNVGEIIKAEGTKGSGEHKTNKSEISLTSKGSCETKLNQTSSFADEGDDDDDCQYVGATHFVSLLSEDDELGEPPSILVKSKVNSVNTATQVQASKEEKYLQDCTEDVEVVIIKKSSEIMNTDDSDEKTVYDAKNKECKDSSKRDESETETSITIVSVLKNENSDNNRIDSTNNQDSSSAKVVWTQALPKNMILTNCHYIVPDLDAFNSQEEVTQASEIVQSATDLFSPGELNSPSPDGKQNIATEPSDSSEKNYSDSSSSTSDSSSSSSNSLSTNSNSCSSGDLERNEVNKTGNGNCEIYENNSYSEIESGELTDDDDSPDDQYVGEDLISGSILQTDNTANAKKAKIENNIA